MTEKLLPWTLNLNTNKLTGTPSINSNKLHEVVHCKNDKIFENYSRKGKQLVNDVESSPVSQSTIDASFKSPSSPAPKATPKRKGAKATATLSK